METIIRSSTKGASRPGSAKTSRVAGRFRAPRTLILLSAVFVAGCSSAPKQQTEPVTSPVLSAPPTTTAPLESTRPVYAGPWEDPGNPLYQRTIYFDYDTAEIKPEYLPVLRTHARYLGTNAGVKAKLEGNTDERGTREYNLALGDQRAESVRRLMIADGVSPNQLSTLSYGEERAANPGHSEQAWRLNRRVVIQY
ncbi:peptidoglycan-associated lipoprotein Pal [Thiocapsa roseopersicina]|uniref:Peptidoglycan-associated protein n=1 Tax=Thiocapsa roseopersicina TaxID=1058 RepID=A0A1H2QJ05_THIRO|nr:peptidoglycan-associated lipoprotein Pal [Thiocapsa roseopersicina]SDW07142.1 peptidoglycan-associated lipoprotein [Thiocapsa roseopersicina]